MSSRIVVVVVVVDTTTSRKLMLDMIVEQHNANATTHDRNDTFLVRSTPDTNDGGCRCCCGRSIIEKYLLLLPPTSRMMMTDGAWVSISMLNSPADAVVIMSLMHFSPVYYCTKNIVIVIPLLGFVVEARLCMALPHAVKSSNLIKLGSILNKRGKFLNKQAARQ